jgi:hypothetical protein
MFFFNFRLIKSGLSIRSVVLLPIVEGRTADNLLELAQSPSIEWLQPCYIRITGVFRPAVLQCRKKDLPLYEHLNLLSVPTDLCFFNGPTEMVLVQSKLTIGILTT